MKSNSSSTVLESCASFIEVLDAHPFGAAIFVILVLVITYNYKKNK
jgi:hypothetical protein